MFISCSRGLVLGSFLAILQLSLAFAPELQKSEPKYELCTTDEPPAALVELGKTHSLNPATAAVKSRANVPVDVYFHVVHEDMTVEGGYIPAQQLDDQFAILYTSILTLGVELTLKGVVRHYNEFFYRNVDNENIRAARVGNYKTLNIFFVGGGIGGGRSDFPIPNATPLEQQTDAVRVHHKTVPGGGGGPNPLRYGWNMGKIAVHEVGHWLGLFHTFHGLGCEREADPITGGDMVADTPVMANPVFGCPDDPDYDDWYYGDSCEPPEFPPNEPDPNWNPMAYWDDRCKVDYFTPGQRARVHMLWPQIRGLF